MDISARRDVVVVLFQFGMVDDAAEFLFFLPVSECIGNLFDALVWDEVLGVAFFEDPT